MIEFDEANRGCWESFTEFVRSWAEDCGLFYGWPEEMMRYFDWSAYERDWRYDFTVVDAPGGMCVFVNL